MTPPHTLPEVWGSPGTHATTPATIRIHEIWQQRQSLNGNCMNCSVAILAPSLPKAYAAGVPSLDAGTWKPYSGGSWDAMGA